MFAAPNNVTPGVTQSYLSADPSVTYINSASTSVSVLISPFPLRLWLWVLVRLSAYPLGWSPMKAVTAVTLRVTSLQTEPWSALVNEIETRRQVVEPMILNPLPVRVMWWFDKRTWVSDVLIGRSVVRTYLVIWNVFSFQLKYCKRNGRMY
jgi:hypothetical protein